MAVARLPRLAVATTRPGAFIPAWVEAWKAARQSAIVSPFLDIIRAAARLLEYAAPQLPFRRNALSPATTAMAPPSLRTRTRPFGARKRPRAVIAKIRSPIRARISKCANTRTPSSLGPDAVAAHTPPTSSLSRSKRPASSCAP